MLNRIKQYFYDNKACIIMLQAMIIANAVFGEDAEAFLISKIVMLFFFIATLLTLLFDKVKIGFGTGIVLPSLFLLYEIASFFWSVNQTIALNQLLTQIQLYILFMFVYLCMYNYGTLSKFFNATYLSGIVLLVYSIYVYEGLINFLFIMETGHRMGDLIGNQNTFGITFSYATLIAFYKYIYDKKLSHLIFALTFVFFAFSSGSKKVAFLLIMGLIILSISKYGVKKIYKGIIVSIISLFVGFFLIQLPIFSTIYKRLESFIQGTSSSDSFRYKLISDGIDLLIDNPLFGYGLNNYRLFNFEQYYSHNNFIELLVSLGIIGFVLFYCIFFKSIIDLFNIRNKLEKMHIIMIFYIVATLVFGYAMVQFYSKSIWIVLGIVLSECDKLKNNISYER